MSREKSLVKNTFIYMIGNFTSRFLGFLLLPLYTNYLTRSDYGYFDLVVTTVSIIIPLITLQINDSMYRYLLDEESEEGANRIITGSLGVTVAGLAVFSILFFIYASFWSFPLSYPILAYIVTLVLSGIWQQIARGLRRNVEYSVSGVLFTAVMLAANLFLILVMHQKLEALFYSSIAASISAIVYLEIKLHVLNRVTWKVKIKLALIKKLAAYSVPLLPNALNWWVITASNRYIIKYFIGTDGNGIFAVSTKFPSILMAFNSVFLLAWQESAIGEYQSEDKNEFYSRMFNYYMKFQFCMLLILIPFTRWGMLIVGEGFADAWKYVPFLYVGTVFMAFSTFYGTGYLSSKDTKGASTTSVAGAGLNIALNLALTPLMGLQAASLSSMAAYAGMWIFRIFQTRKYFRIAVDKKSLSALIGLSALFIVLFYVNNLIIDMAMAVVSLAVFYLFNRELTARAYRLIRNRLALKTPETGHVEGDHP